MNNAHDLKEDPRYKIGLRQALWIIGIYVAYCVGAVLIAFPLSIFRPKNLPMAFIMGFPDWVFLSCLLWPTVMVIVTILVVLTKFKEVNLGPLDISESEKGA